MSGSPVHHQEKPDGDSKTAASSPNALGEDSPSSQPVKGLMETEYPTEFAPHILTKQNIFMHFNPDAGPEVAFSPLRSVSTLNAGQDTPNSIKFVILFPNAHPRWKENLLFTKTNLACLPGYDKQMGQYAAMVDSFKKDQEKRRNAAQKAAAEDTKKKEADEVALGQDEGSAVSPSGAAVDEKGHSSQTAVPGKESPTAPNQSSTPPSDIPEQEETGGLKSEMPQAVSTTDAPNAEGSSEAHPIDLTDDKPSQLEKEGDKRPSKESTAEPDVEPVLCDSIDYLPPTHEPVAFFRSYDGNGTDINFVGYYHITNIAILPAGSPKIKDLLEQKWATDRSKRSRGRGRGNRNGGHDGDKRQQDAWKKDTFTEWGVIKVAKLWPRSEGCPPEPEIGKYQPPAIPTTQAPGACRDICLEYMNFDKGGRDATTSHARGGDVRDCGEAIENAAAPVGQSSRMSRDVRLEYMTFDRKGSKDRSTGQGKKTDAPIVKDSDEAVYKVLTAGDSNKGCPDTLDKAADKAAKVSPEVADPAIKEET